MYYEINENSARRAKEANSYSDYKEGSATAGYKSAVDEVCEIAEKQKKKVDPEYHGKIDYLVDLYARKLAENLNKRNEIDARVPSILITGGGNFPIRKKEKQNAAREKNYAEYNRIQGIVRKIRTVGTGGIRSDKNDAIGKLEKKLAKLVADQELMKSANRAIRLKDTEKGNEKLSELGFTDEQIEALRTPDFAGRIGYQSFRLSNNNANIRRIKKRIEELKAEQDSGQAEDKEFQGFILREDTAAVRIQFLFDDKPDEETRSILKANGFRWSPKNKAWQRMLNRNGRNAAETVIRKIEELKPAVINA